MKEFPSNIEPEHAPRWNPSPEEKAEMYTRAVWRLTTREGIDECKDPNKCSLGWLATAFEDKPLEAPEILEVARLGAIELILHHAGSDSSFGRPAGRLLKALGAENMFNESPLVEMINAQLQHPNEGMPKELLPFAPLIKEFKESAKGPLTVHSLLSFSSGRSPRIERI